MPRRRYSDHEKAEALAMLAANAGNVARTARQVHVPRQTLQEWAAGRGLSPAVPELRHEKKAALADRLEDLAHRLLDLMPDKIGAANLQHCAVALGIAIDKLLRLRGQPAGIAGLDLSRLGHDQRGQFERLVRR